MKGKSKIGRLSAERTHLANERTFLAYVRTALAFFALGALIIKFLSSEYFMIGIVSLIFGFALVAHGAIKFVRNREKIDKM